MFLSVYTLFACFYMLFECEIAPAAIPGPVQVIDLDQSKFITY